MPKLKMLTALLSILVVCGCYTSKTPLKTETDVNINPALCGSWKKTGGDSYDFFRVFKFSEKEYLIEATSVEEKGIHSEFFRAFAVRLGKNEIFNLQPIKDIEDEHRSWLFLKADFGKDGALSLQLLDAEKFKGEYKTPKELSAALEKALDKANPFSALGTYKKVEKRNK